MPRIALIPGDGIGVEVVREARRVLEFVSEAEGVPFELVEWDLGADRFLRDGITITEDEFVSLDRDHDAVLLGALGDPGGHFWTTWGGIFWAFLGYFIGVFRRVAFSPGF